MAKVQMYVALVSGTVIFSIFSHVKCLEVFIKTQEIITYIQLRSHVGSVYTYYLCKSEFCLFNNRHQQHTKSRRIHLENVYGALDYITSFLLNCHAKIHVQTLRIFNALSMKKSKIYLYFQSKHISKLWLQTVRGCVE